MAERFTGEIEPFAQVSVEPLAAFLEAIPVSDWPKLADPAFRGAGELLRPLAEALLSAHFPGGRISGLGLFLLDPGQVHPTHTDEQAPDWLCRVHVPVVTNRGATATTDSGTIHMEAGTAYKFNTLARHAVENRGNRPRIHMVFDVKAA